MGTTRRQPQPGRDLVHSRIGQRTEVTPIRRELKLHRPRCDGSDQLLVSAMRHPGHDGVPGRDQHHQTGARSARDTDPIIQRRDGVGEGAEPRITPLRSIHRRDLHQRVLQVRTQLQRQQRPDLGPQLRIPPPRLRPVRPRPRTRHPTEVENWLIAGHDSSDHDGPTVPGAPIQAPQRGISGGSCRT